MKAQLFQINHTTTYYYQSTVTVSHHLLRLAPRRSSRQSRLEHRLWIEPAAAVISQHTDYFGNPTHFTTVERAHAQLVIQSTSQVAVGPAFVPEPAETPPWESVRDLLREDRAGQSLEAHEFTYPSPLVPLAPEYAEYAALSFPTGRPLLDAVQDLTARIHQNFQFQAGATTVTTPLSEVFRHRRGVCQDLAQFEIACLRSLGLPARYVSGYVETEPPPGMAKLRGTDASHAWISFYCPGLGWIDMDPTNNCFASMRHVTLGWGRDYSDVAPVRGVLVGSEGQTLVVSVDVIPQGETELPEEAE